MTDVNKRLADTIRRAERLLDRTEEHDIVSGPSWPRGAIDDLQEKEKLLSHYDLLYKAFWHMTKMTHDLGIAVGAAHNDAEFMHCNNETCRLASDILRITKR